MNQTESNKPSNLIPPHLIKGQSQEGIDNSMDMEEVKADIYTSYYAKSAKLPNAISISRGTPTWFTGPSYEPLFPEWNLILNYKDGKITEDEYRIRYNDQLSKLDPKVVYKELEGKVLLCWETSNQICHRHLVAEWLNKHLGITVKELGMNSNMDPKILIKDKDKKDIMDKINLVFNSLLNGVTLDKEKLSIKLFKKGDIINCPQGKIECDDYWIGSPLSMNGETVYVGVDMDLIEFIKMASSYNNLELMQLKEFDPPTQ